MIAAIAAGVAAGVLLTVAPLMVVVAAGALGVVAAVRRQSDDTDRRAATIIVISALVVRVLVVAAWAMWSIPTLSAQSGGILLGDEGYLFERSLRTRDVLVGAPVTKLDYVMAYETYADTKYTAWVTWLQTVFGPSPYSIRMLNGVMFVAAACIMFSIARRAFGSAPALIGLVVLLFLPSMLFWSVSLLKDSTFFLFTAAAFAAAIAVVRSPGTARVIGVVVLAISLWVLADLRPAAVVLTGGGLAVGLALQWSFSSRKRLAIAATVGLAAAIAVSLSDRASTRLLRELTTMSQQHFGHASTRGHAYRTLDDEFYRGYMAALGGQPLEVDQATRYVARSAWAFMTVPLPWQVITRGELAFIPEQMLWYVLVGLACIGVGAAYRRDALVCSLLVGYSVLMSAALALINGNVGTLIRLRTLVSRFVIWIAAVGIAIVIERMARRQQSDDMKPVDDKGPSAGRINIVDALCVALAALLVPIGYASWLLFQPATPRISRVERSEITSAEERVAAGEAIRLKVKVHGENLTPMLRAYIGRVPAIGFTFETPESGDVIIGTNVPPGTHDLILYDGLLEVARAPHAVTIGDGTGVPAAATLRVRVAASHALIDAVKVGDRDIRPLPPDGQPARVEQAHRTNDGLHVVVRLGVYREGNGWQYQSHPLIAGHPFTLVTDRYSVVGEITELLIDGK